MQDHADSTRAMVKHYVGLTVSKATILSLDRLGMNLVVEKEGHPTPFKLRLPFPRWVGGPKPCTPLVCSASDNLVLGSICAAARHAELTPESQGGQRSMFCRWFGMGHSGAGLHTRPA